MKKSNNLVVHLTTGFIHLIKYWNNKKRSSGRFRRGVATAIKNDLNFSYIKEAEVDDYIEGS